MLKLVVFLLLFCVLVHCKINEQVKGEQVVKTPRLLSPSKSRLLEPTITTVQTTTTTRAPIKEITQQRIVEEIPQQRLEEPKKVPQQIIQQQQQEEQKHLQQEEVLLQIKQQHDNNIRQQLQQQQHFEQQLQQEQKTPNCEPQVKGKIVQQKIEQIIEQKQSRNERLTEEEEAIAEPFPLIPKTSFTCEGKPILPGLYADQETGCRVYHYCPGTPAPIKEKIVQQQVQLQELEQPEIKQSQIASIETQEVEKFKSFFCGEGTLFNQKLLVCDHVANVICSDSPHYYSANSEFGKPSAEPTPGLERAQLQGKTAPIKQQPIIEQQRLIWEPAQQLQEEPNQPVKRPTTTFSPLTKGNQRLEQESIGFNNPNFGSWRTEHSSHTISRTNWGSSNDGHHISDDRLTSGTVGRRMSDQSIVTGFSCHTKPFQTGLYADLESNCVMYHQCLNSRKTTFKCASGQRFDQRTLSCISELKVNCLDSANYYNLNSRFN